MKARYGPSYYAEMVWGGFRNWIRSPIRWSWIYLLEVARWLDLLIHLRSELEELETRVSDLEASLPYDGPDNHEDNP